MLLCCVYTFALKMSKPKMPSIRLPSALTYVIRSALNIVSILCLDCDTSDYYRYQISDIL